MYRAYEYSEKNRLFEWVKSSTHRRRNGKRVRQVYPGWAILDAADEKV